MHNGVKDTLTDLNFDCEEEELHQVDYMQMRPVPEI